MKLTIIGMGAEEGDLSLRALEAARNADSVLLSSARTAAAKTVVAAGIPFRSLDGEFDRARNFDTLAKRLASEVLRKAREKKSVAYLVEGSAAEDRSARLILEKYPDTEIVAGVGKGQSLLAKAGLGAGETVSAYDLPSRDKIGFPLAVFDIDSAYIASEVKLRLFDLAGEETECLFFANGVGKTIPLYALDREEKYDDSCGLVVKEGDFLKKERYDYADLIRLVKMLRAPGGCPWDREQTHASIRMNLIEEAYELAEAIDLGDDDKMLEETGDVLLQAVFHEVLAEERGAFTPADAATAICKKLIFRHSHVFGTDAAATGSEALGNWEKNKLVEKKQSTASDAVRDVPKTFPALLRACKVLRRAAKTGFDFDGAGAALDDAEKRAEEFRRIAATGDAVRIEEAGGDFLLAAADAVRLAGGDAEQALTRAIERFTERFCRMEAAIRADGRKAEELTREEFVGYYRAAKGN